MRFPSNLAPLLLSASLIFFTNQALGRDNESPSKPENFQANSTSDSSIALSWDESTDNKRVKFYVLSRNGVKISNVKTLTYTDTNLQASTLYSYEIEASDGRNRSYVAATSASTSPSDGDGATPGDEVEEPEEPAPPPPEPEPEEPAPITPGEVPAGWNLVFNDEFDGSGDLDTSGQKNWIFEKMTDALNRSGNSGMERDGTIRSGVSVQGKRWSAWYDDYNDQNAYRNAGHLVMGGTVSSERDPTRPQDYTDQGVLTQFGNNKLYTAWIDTWARKKASSGEYYSVDPNSPGITFKYGYFETRVNFSAMTTPGFRTSMWLMPASRDAAGQDLVVSNAFNADGDDGIEMDLFEYEPYADNNKNRIEVSAIGGSAGNVKSTLFGEQHNINLSDGWHTVGFLWQEDILRWSVDGITVLEVTDQNFIPDVYSYLIISREMNSGVKRADNPSVVEGDMLEQLPYVPQDTGLYYNNVWEYKSRILGDHTLFDYVKVWQPG